MHIQVEMHVGYGGVEMPRNQHRSSALTRETPRASIVSMMPTVRVDRYQRVRKIYGVRCANRRARQQNSTASSRRIWQWTGIPVSRSRLTGSNR